MYLKEKNKMNTTDEVKEQEGKMYSKQEILKVFSGMLSAACNVAEWDLQNRRHIEAFTKSSLEALFQETLTMSFNIKLDSYKNDLLGM